MASGSVGRRLVAGLLFTLLGFWAVTLASNLSLVGAAWRQWRELAVAEATTPSALAACAADPAGFSRRASPLVRVGVAGDAVPGWSRGDDGLRHVEIVTAPADGPCGRLAVVTALPWPVLVRQAGLVSIRVGAVLLLVMVAWAMAVRPVGRRLRELARGSRAIVAAGFRGELPVAGDDELDAVARAFNAAARTARERLAQLEQRDKAVREMVADVAHDVRTPIAALKMELGRAVTDRDAAPRVLAEIEYLDALVGNLATGLELDAAAPPRHRVDGRELVGRAVARFERLASARGVRVDGSVPDEALPIDGDSVALQQALGNLVHNAVGFAAGHVAVVGWSEGGEVVLEVLDDGPGIAADELPRLTERSFRGGGATRMSGRGLGLTIANEVAARHGGRLVLERLPDGGTRAALRLPLAP